MQNFHFIFFKLNSAFLHRLHAPPSFLFFSFSVFHVFIFGFISIKVVLFNFILYSDLQQCLKHYTIFFNCFVRKLHARIIMNVDCVSVLPEHDTWPFSTGFRILRTWKCYSCAKFRILRIFSENTNFLFILENMWVTNSSSINKHLFCACYSVSKLFTLYCPDWKHLNCMNMQNCFFVSK